MFFVLSKRNTSLPIRSAREARKIRKIRRERKTFGP
jgi:hypothetical protein